MHAIFHYCDHDSCPKNKEFVQTTAAAVAMGMEKLSFSRGKASDTEQAMPPDNAAANDKSKKNKPRNTAMENEAKEPDTDAVALILGDGIDFPTKEAKGSANDRHSTAYRATFIGKKDMEHRVPHKNQKAPGSAPSWSSLFRKRGPNKDRYNSLW